MSERERREREMGRGRAVKEDMEVEETLRRVSVYHEDSKRHIRYHRWKLR